MALTTISAKTPDLLCIGFLCHDLHEGTYILGGTASYASLLASRLGLHTAVVTSVGKDFKFLDLFQKEGIELAIKPAPATTVFQNIYQDGSRSQYLLQRSATLLPADVPMHWRSAPVVKFCLIADEADLSLLHAFPGALIGATIQGWLRQWDRSGKISPKTINWELLQPVDIVFMSDADLPDPAAVLPALTKIVRLVVMTKGANGATVFQQNEAFSFPSFPVEEVDPTGAGDVFATAFLIHYDQTKDIALAAAYAHAAASIVVEHPGAKVPDKEEVEVRYQAYQHSFFG